MPSASLNLSLPELKSTGKKFEDASAVGAMIPQTLYDFATSSLQKNDRSLSIKFSGYSPLFGNYNVSRFFDKYFALNSYLWPLTSLRNFSKV